MAALACLACIMAFLGFFSIVVGNRSSYQHIAERHDGWPMAIAMLGLGTIIVVAGCTVSDDQGAHKVAQFLGWVIALPFLAWVVYDLVRKCRNDGSQDAAVPGTPGLRFWYRTFFVALYLLFGTVIGYAMLAKP